MSTTTQTEELTPKPVNKRTGWRMINTTIILIAFFGPWFKSCSFNANGTVNGVETALIMGAGSVSSHQTHETIDSSPSILFALVCLGLISIFIYCVLNMVVLLPNNRLIAKPIWIDLVSGFLALGGAGLSLMLALDPEWLWGYWLAWVGLASSIWLEIRTHLTGRSEKLKVV